VTACKPDRHLFEPFTPSPDLGGGAQRCRCGRILIDRLMSGGRAVEISPSIMLNGYQAKCGAASGENQQ